MENLHEKINYFNKKKMEIMAMNKVAEAEAMKLRNEAEAKIGEAYAPVRKAAEEYKAEMKAWAGVTDGESADILSTIELIASMTTPKLIT